MYYQPATDEIPACSRQDFAKLQIRSSWWKRQKSGLLAKFFKHTICTMQKAAMIKPKSFIQA